MATRIITGLSALALCTVGIGSAAIAQKLERVSVKVKYSDLNLASEAGQKALHSRIKSAVREVCGQDLVGDLKAQSMQQKCRADALSSAEFRAGNVIAEYQAGRNVAAKSAPRRTN
jgi:UrcA family protein